jgi:hypothetical protein
MDTLEWYYNNEVFTEEMIGDNYGFVYLITNISNNKKYIGKKFFYSMRSKTVKGKKKRSKVFSDWKSYYGSNQILKDEVSEKGKETFKREIIHLCLSKGECNYMEAREQFIKDVLRKPDEYYNHWIMVRVQRSHLKYTLTNDAE